MLYIFREFLINKIRGALAYHLCYNKKKKKKKHLLQSHIDSNRTLGIIGMIMDRSTSQIFTQAIQNFELQIIFFWFKILYSKNEKLIREYVCYHLYLSILQLASMTHTWPTRANFLPNCLSQVSYFSCLYPIWHCKKKSCLKKILKFVLVSNGKGKMSWNCISLKLKQHDPNLTRWNNSHNFCVLTCIDTSKMSSL